MNFSNLCPKLHVSGAKFTMNPVDSIVSILAHSPIGLRLTLVSEDRITLRCSWTLLSRVAQHPMPTLRKDAPRELIDTLDELEKTADGCWRPLRLLNYPSDH